jgi:hypothetical protein
MNDKYMKKCSVFSSRQESINLECLSGKAARACNNSTQEAKAGGSRNQGQRELHSKTLSHKQTNKQTHPQ